ncbi:MAG: hypothetical protein GAK33_07797 [Burkholderia lata]|uniref:Uncharacterized protein n=1 Tax=Burkholderia lata (strain ATCC 17760 / DSM 23089 / LMG 22485 / NCIMB 9086 / R18194 / 383) TaxID=482957 RepID=A0A833PLJ7_BURL3|nr:MAG: hypothetical protein GAK33_07797 [Burkholderia lata]
MRCCWRCCQLAAMTRLPATSASVSSRIVRRSRVASVARLRGRINRNVSSVRKVASTHATDWFRNSATSGRNGLVAPVSVLNATRYASPASAVFGTLVA